MGKWKSVFLVIICCTMLSGCDTAENVLPQDKTFVKLYGKDGDQLGVDLKQLPNKDIIILTRFSKPINSSFMLIYVDSDGNELWQKEYSPDSGKSEIPVALTIDQNGNYIVVGNSVSVNSNDIFIAKISSLGEILMKRTINIEGFEDATTNRIDMAQDVIVNNLNESIISGYSKDGQNSLEEFFAIKLDENLNDDNNWVYKVNPSENYRRIQSKLGFTNNRIIAVSTSNLFAAETAPADLNIETFFLDPESGFANFATDGTSFIGTDFYDEINSLSKTNNGFAFIGTIIQTTSSSLIVGELGPNGIKTGEFILPNRNLQGVDIGKNNITGRLVILAEETISADNKNVHMAEVDDNGSIVWEHAYGGNDIDEAAAILIDGDQIYLLGTLRMNSQNKVVLIKTDGNGKL